MGKWLKELSTGTFHEVDDPDAVHAAYPGQYEAVPSTQVTKTKVGFGEPEVGKWADGTEASTEQDEAPATPVQNEPAPPADTTD